MAGETGPTTNIDRQDLYFVVHFMHPTGELEIRRVHKMHHEYISELRTLTLV